MKKIVFLDGDGTLWYPKKTKRTVKPWWIYEDAETKDNHLEHLMLSPSTLATLRTLKQHGVVLILLSTQPDALKDAIVVLETRVRHFELHGVFDELYATAEHKTAKAEKILEILDRLRLKKSDALMVGDNYRWDYQPAINAGIDAVLINSDYHQEKKEKEPAKILIDELDGILPIVLNS